MLINDYKTNKTEIKGFISKVHFKLPNFYIKGPDFEFS